MRIPLAGWWLALAGHLANKPRKEWGGQGPRCHFLCWAVEGFSQFPPHFSVNRDTLICFQFAFMVRIILTMYACFTTKFDLANISNNSTVMFQWFSWCSSLFTTSQATAIHFPVSICARVAIKVITSGPLLCCLFRIDRGLRFGQVSSHSCDLNITVTLMQTENESFLLTVCSLVGSTYMPSTGCFTCSSPSANTCNDKKKIHWS